MTATEMLVCAQLLNSHCAWLASCTSRNFIKLKKTEKPKKKSSSLY